MASTSPDIRVKECSNHYRHSSRTKYVDATPCLLFQRVHREISSRPVCTFFSSNSERKYRHSPSQPSPRLRKFTIFFERRFFRPHPTAAVTTATAQCTKKTVVKKYESDICQQVGSWLRQSCPGNRSTRLYPAIRPQLNALHSTEAHFVCVRLP